MVDHFLVTVICGGTCKGRQVIHLVGQDRARAETFAGLVDGTSPLYVVKPGPESMIGKCGICLGPITTTVEEDKTPPVGRGPELVRESGEAPADD